MFPSSHLVPAYVQVFPVVFLQAQTLNFPKPQGAEEQPVGRLPSQKSQGK